MSKNRYINTKFWDDVYISSLGSLEKLLFIYLITNALTSICGIYEIGLERMSFDTKIESTTIEIILTKFKKDNKFKYIDNWIVAINFIKHQKQSDNPNDNINKGIKKELEKVPVNIKKEIDY